jgi:hypothetical protein
MASSKAGIGLSGRFPAGTTVRLVKVEGPHVLRPGPNHETVDTQTVEKDGTLSFSKGVEAGERYFAVATVNGEPREVRLTGKADPDEGFLAGYEPIAPERVRLGIGGSGGWADEEPERPKGEEVPDGATWEAQHDVKRGTLQRSDTPRGTAAVVSAEERERARKQYRKQDPTVPVVEATPDPQDEEARTAEEPDRSPAKSRRG